MIDSNNFIISRRFPHDPKLLIMLARGGVASTNGSGRPKKNGWKDIRGGHLRSERLISVLSKYKFQAHFHILDSISIHLIDDETLSSAKQPNNTMYFTEEQFVAGLYLPFPSFFMQFLHFTQTSLAFFYPNVVRVLMRCSVLDMLFQLDLSLLEILFVYTIKSSHKERLSLTTHIYSL